MWEEAAKISVLGVQVYAYGLYTALGAAWALAALGLRLRRMHAPKGATGLIGLCALALGLVFSRLFYCLMDGTLGTAMPLKAYALLSGGGYSMMGALCGAALGGVAGAKLLKMKPLRVLDQLTYACLLFIFWARLGESCIPDFGVSRPLVGRFIQQLPIALEGEYDFYLATYDLEALMALLIFLALWRDGAHHVQPGDTLRMFLLLFGATQVVMESLRYDRHMSISFVGLQQIMAMALLGAGVIWGICREGRSHRALAISAGAALTLAVGLGIVLEFMIDRTNISRYLLYLAMALVLAAPTALGIALRNKGEMNHGKTSGGSH